MFISDFIQAAKLLPSDVSVLIRGERGIGKSDTVRALADHFNLPLIDRRISQMTEGDLIGLPRTEERKSGAAVTRFQPLDWFMDAVEKPHLIFLDELDRASGEVQQAIFELVLDRSVQGTKIHPDCRIYSAINGGQGGHNYQVNEMDPALLDRFWTCDLETNLDQWLSWARKNKVNASVVNFLAAEGREHLDVLHEDDLNTISPSCRSWTRLAKVLDQNEDIMDLENADNRRKVISLASGFVGIEATSALVNYIRSEKVFTAEDILEKWDKNKKYFEDDSKKYIENVAMLSNLFEKIYSYIDDHKKLTKKKMKNLSEFWHLLLPEQQASFYGNIHSRNWEGSLTEAQTQALKAMICQEFADQISVIYSSQVSE